MLFAVLSCHEMLPQPQQSNFKVRVSQLCLGLPDTMAKWNCRFGHGTRRIWPEIWAISGRFSLLAKPKIPLLYVHGLATPGFTTMQETELSQTVFCCHFLCLQKLCIGYFVWVMQCSDHDPRYWTIFNQLWYQLVKTVSYVSIIFPLPLLESIETDQSW